MLHVFQYLASRCLWNKWLINVPFDHISNLPNISVDARKLSILRLKLHRTYLIISRLHHLSLKTLYLITIRLYSVYDLILIVVDSCIVHQFHLHIPSLIFNLPSDVDNFISVSILWRYVVPATCDFLNFMRGVGDISTESEVHFFEIFEFRLLYELIGW